MPCLPGTVPLARRTWVKRSLADSRPKMEVLLVRVGLIDIGSKMPNLALMKIATYHKALGDTVTLNSGGEINYISCCFTKYRKEMDMALKLYPNSVIGGPGWDQKISLPPEIDLCRPDYSLYGINYGLGRLTAGCPGDCPWCVVPACEGLESKTVAYAGDIANGDFLVLLDANILACPDWPDHFREIRERGLTACFTQGLDIRYVNDFVASELARLKVSNLSRKHNQIWFAWDRPENGEHVRAGIAALNKAGIKSYRLRFYVMVGYNTTWEQDYHRFTVLRDLGAEPFIMLYEGSGRKLRDFARYVNRFIYKSCSWSEYDSKGRRESVGGQQALNF